MSGFAFSALALFGVLLPGLVLQFRYYQKASSWDATGTVDIGSARSILLAIIFSLPIHALWGWGIILVDGYVVSIGRINYADFFAILQGTEISEHSTLYQQMTGALPWKVTAYVWSQAIFAFFAGSMWARLSVTFERDKSIALGSQGAMWHRLLRYVPDDPDWIVVTVTLCLDNKTRLYKGILQKYELTLDGNLRYLDLEGTSRKEISDTGTDNPVYFMPGEHFIIDCSSIETFDIDYFWAADETEEAEGDQDPGREVGSEKAAIPTTIIDAVKRKFTAAKRKLGRLLGATF